MNYQPVDYKQTDTRWKNEPYRVSGESSTIGSAGCGPTCAAMVISTLKDKTVTPKTCCDWSMAHGYKALNQGTYYAYFVPQMAAYGIPCRQLTGGYDEAVKLLKEGYYVIALMGKGLWTSGGHFVLAWWADNKIHINDPASTDTARLNGDPALFRAQAKYFWAIDAREYNKNGKALPDNVTAKAVKTVSVDLPVLSMGDKGSAVKALQGALTALGYPCGKADGDFGNGTKSAVVKFQRDKKISADGVCGKQTWTKLLK